jgi:hypothetical protein
LACFAHAREVLRTPGGHRHPNVHRSEGSDRVAVLMEVPDMNKLQAAMQAPGAAEAMAHDGVLAETLVILVEA